MATNGKILILLFGEVSSSITMRRKSYAKQVPEGAKEPVQRNTIKAELFEDDDTVSARMFSSAPLERSTSKIQYPGFRQASTPGLSSLTALR